MARGHRLNTSIVLAAVHCLFGLFQVISVVKPSLIPPPPNKQPRFCGRKATWSREGFTYKEQDTRKVVSEPRRDQKREVEVGCHSELHSLLLQISTAGLSYSAFVALFDTDVERAISGVRKLLGTGGVPASLTTALFWQWLMVSLVFVGQTADVGQTAGASC